jgi:hypothetical protein
LTAEPITTAEDAWGVVFAYARRWQIELAWRFDKSALAFQSPRLWRWQERAKLLAMATVAYAFLLHLVAPRYELLRLWLLRTDLASHWLALTLGQGPALPPTLGTQSLVAALSTLLCCLGQATPWAKSWSSHLRLFALCW